MLAELHGGGRAPDAIAVDDGTRTRADGDGDVAGSADACPAARRAAPGPARAQRGDGAVCAHVPAPRPQRTGGGAPAADAGHHRAASAWSGCTPKRWGPSWRGGCTAAALADTPQ